MSNDKEIISPSYLYDTMLCLRDTFSCMQCFLVANLYNFIGGTDCLVLHFKTGTVTDSLVLLMILVDIAYSMNTEILYSRAYIRIITDSHCAECPENFNSCFHLLFITLSFLNSRCVC